MDTTLKIEGMTCQHCVAAVQQALLSVPGVTGAEVSLERNDARVAGEFDLAAAQAAVEEEGYKVLAGPSLR